MTDMLGPYELRGELGRGAMAIVWRGFDPMLEREVAIKEPVIPATADDVARADLSERFVREGRAAAKLNHPGIVTIHAADVYDGRPAIVMELIEGETLSAVLCRGALPAPAALSILDQLLDAVAYAHERGVVHRDIKPDNVFVNGDGRVKLADFGIAHVGGGATLTQAGTIMGTPGYMAPEQVTGEAVDARADIFAIGAIAYEMLSGKNPFGATDGVAPTTVMYRVVHEMPAPLPDLLTSPNVASVVATALAKEPSARFTDARTFRASLASAPIVTGVTAGLRGAAAYPAQPGHYGNPAAAAKGTQSSVPPAMMPYLVFGVVAVVGLAALFSFGGFGSAGTGLHPPGSGQVSGPARTLHGVTATASSELPLAGAVLVRPYGGAPYTPAHYAINVLDGDWQTAWEPNPSVAGDWIEVQLAQASILTEIRVVPASAQVANGVDQRMSKGRVKSATFTFSHGASTSFDFADTKGWQTVPLARPVTTSSVRMTIDSVYPPLGSTSSVGGAPVSEIEFTGWPGGASGN